jgi:hypothetical protein
MREGEMLVAIDEVGGREEETMHNRRQQGRLVQKKLHMLGPNKLCDLYYFLNS